MQTTQIDNTSALCLLEGAILTNPMPTVCIISSSVNHATVPYHIIPDPISPSAVHVTNLHENVYYVQGAVPR